MDVSHKQCMIHIYAKEIKRSKTRTDEHPCEPPIIAEPVPQHRLRPLPLMHIHRLRPNRHPRHPLRGAVVYDAPAAPVVRSVVPRARALAEPDPQRAVAVEEPAAGPDDECGERIFHRRELNVGVARAVPMRVVGCMPMADGCEDARPRED